MGRAEWETAAKLFGCLSSPMRVGIIILLVDGPKSVGELVDATGGSQPLISQHLKLLKERCLVCAQKDGRRMTYRLTDAHVSHIVLDAVEHTTEHPHHHTEE